MRKPPRPRSQSVPAEPALERGEMRADRRGGEIERELRVGEAVRLDQRDEDPEQAEVDRVEAAHAVPAFTSRFFNVLFD